MSARIFVLEDHASMRDTLVGFVSALPDKPKAVRIVFYRYHMGQVAWWTRDPVGTLGPLPCP